MPEPRLAAPLEAAVGGACYGSGVLLSRTRRSLLLGSCLLGVGLLAGCTSSTDSIGHDNPSLAPTSSAAGAGPELPTSLKSLTGPTTYANVFHDLFNYTTDTVNRHVEDVYQQLFHGDPDTQAIYFTKDNDGGCDFPTGDNEACINDLYHSDVRTEGLGIGMLVSVELNHQDEFDRLWNYAKHWKLVTTGAPAGYFQSFCDLATSGTTTSTANGSRACVDPYGLQMFATALIFAHDRWKTSLVGNIDYQAEALAILDVMLHKEDRSGGTSDGFTNTFDAETKLVFDEPIVMDASRTRPSILMPAFYELWGQATGNPFFSSAAEEARTFLGRVADPSTGLVPLRAYFDLTPKPGEDTFQAEAYRVFPNLVLDQVWFPDQNPAAAPQFKQVLSFFLQQGFDTYGSAYHLDGTPVADKTDHEIALVIVNGLTAGYTTTIKDSDRARFVQAVWKLDTPTKDYRYYQGILELFALCVLSGQMQVL